MKEISYVCNMCKKPIKDHVHRIFVGIIDKETDEIVDEGTFYMEETGEADFCSDCLTQIDATIAKMISKGAVDNSESVSSSRGRKNVKLDMTEVIEMRNRGVSLENIANRFGCSPQTVQNHLMKIGYYKTNDQGDIVL